MNKVELVGRLTKDPELKQTSNQKSYCNFTIAVDRRFKDANGQRQADFINCVAWNQTAEFLQKYFKKGNRIGICGCIQTRSYENEQQKHFVTEVLAEEVEFVESQQKTDSAPSQESASVHDSPPVQEEGGNLPFEI